MDPSISDCLFSHGFLSSINTAIPVARWCRQESNLKHKLQAARWTLQGSKISCNFESVYLLIFVDFSSLFCIGCWKFRIVRFVFLDPRYRTGFIVPKLIGLRVTCRKFDQEMYISGVPYFPAFDSRPRFLSLVPVVLETWRLWFKPC
jgi:hypothetical protein